MTTVTETPRREARLQAVPFDIARAARNVGAVALAALPGALTVYLSFNSGGFYAGAQGAVVAILAGTVAVRMAVIRDPFGGFSWPLWLAIAALAIYSIWALLSSRWSHSSARALLDFNLANVYLFALVLFGSSARSHRRVQWTVALTWLSMLGVCVVSLATRLRPDLFPIPANLSPNRLAFPLTYWNALGLFAVVGITIAMYLGGSARESRAMRALATAAMPAFAVVILLTFSRAAIILGAGGLLAYALLARPRGLLSVVLAAGPATAFAIAKTYQANLIANASTSPAAVQQGRHLTTMLLAACLAAGLIRIALFELDVRLSKFEIRPRTRVNIRSSLALLCVAGALIGALAFGHQISNQWDAFTKKDSALGSNDVRNRIGSIRIGGRIPTWRIAVKSFDRAPLLGHGAGTFAIDWDQRRPNGATALETHSLYLEAMSELGIVGVVSIAFVVLILIGGCFVRARSPARSLWIAVGIVGLVWALHAGLDWDWEMPAATLPVFALSACALGRRGGGARLRPRLELVLRVAVGFVALAAAFAALTISVSDNHLVSAVTEFNSGNCGAAVSDARASIHAVASRPQPYAIIGYCDVLNGSPGRAVTEMREAVTHDPQNWRYLYGLAIAEGAAGQDPHEALRAALALDPLEPMIQTANASLSGGNPERWRQLAPGLQMPVSMRA